MAIPPEDMWVLAISGFLSGLLQKLWSKPFMVQRCQLHKKRNVLDQLPERMRPSVSAALSQAYASRDKATALRLLHNLERRLAKEHPGAAASLREGLAAGRCARDVARRAERDHRVFKLRGDHLRRRPLIAFAASRDCRN